MSWCANFVVLGGGRNRRQKRLIFQVCTSKMNLSDDVDLEDYVSRTTPPLPCVSTAFVAKTLPLPCVSTALDQDSAFVLCFHCLRGEGTAFALRSHCLGPRQCICLVFPLPSRLIHHRLSFPVVLRPGQDQRGRDYRHLPGGRHARRPEEPVRPTAPPTTTACTACNTDCVGAARTRPMVSSCVLPLPAGFVLSSAL